jgi:hypothetical protein
MQFESLQARDVTKRSLSLSLVRISMMVEYCPLWLPIGHKNQYVHQIFTLMSNTTPYGESYNSTSVIELRKALSEICSSVIVGR